MLLPFLRGVGGVMGRTLAKFLEHAWTQLRLPGNVAREIKWNNPPPGGQAETGAIVSPWKQLKSPPPARLEAITLSQLSKCHRGIRVSTRETGRLAILPWRARNDGTSG